MDYKDISEHLSSIEQRLEGINKKLSNKWFLPVFITVLSCLLGLVTFYIQQNVKNNDINKNKEREIIGAFLGETKVAFYRSCKDSLIRVDEHFQSYCQLGQEEQVLSDLTTSLANFKKFRDAQTIIDQEILEALKDYSEFVTENTFAIYSKNIEHDMFTSIYMESKVLYNEASEKLNNGIRSLHVE